MKKTPMNLYASTKAVIWKTWEAIRHGFLYGLQSIKKRRRKKKRTEQNSWWGGRKKLTLALPSNRNQSYRFIILVLSYSCPTYKKEHRPSLSSWLSPFWTPQQIMFLFCICSVWKFGLWAFSSSPAVAWFRAVALYLGWCESCSHTLPATGEHERSVNEENTTRRRFIVKIRDGSKLYG